MNIFVRYGKIKLNEKRNKKQGERDDSLTNRFD